MRETPERQKQRERSKRAKWAKQNKEGTIGRKNAYGQLDLTAHNASGLLVDKQFAIQYR